MIAYEPGSDPQLGQYGVSRAVLVGVHRQSCRLHYP